MGSSHSRIGGILRRVINRQLEKIGEAADCNMRGWVYKKERRTGGTINPFYSQQQLVMMGNAQYKEKQRREGAVRLCTSNNGVISNRDTLHFRHSDSFFPV